MVCVLNMFLKSCYKASDLRLEFAVSFENIWTLVFVLHFNFLNGKHTGGEKDEMQHLVCYLFLYLQSLLYEKFCFFVFHVKLDIFHIKKLNDLWLWAHFHKSALINNMYDMFLYIKCLGTTTSMFTFIKLYIYTLVFKWLKGP